MADISRFFFFSHLRGEQSSHILHYSRGQLSRSGRGLSFWFLPMTASIAEVPIDDREQAFLFHGRCADFQDVTAQGVITYRVVDPELVAQRVDFTIDLRTGLYTKTPLDKLSLQLTQLAQQFADGAVASKTVRQLLEGGFDPVRDAVREGLMADPGLQASGLEIVSVRLNSIKPTSELEKALQMPMREAIQQDADQATFQRRAMAVENERAIAENELQNRIELAKREEMLIEQEGANQRRQAQEEAEARRIAVEAKAARTRVEATATAEQTRLQAGAEAESIVLVEKAKVDAEKERMDIYRELPTNVMVGLAAQELAGKLHSIDHLNVSPELFGPMLTQLITAGTRRLEAE